MKLKSYSTVFLLFLIVCNVFSQTKLTFKGIMNSLYTKLDSVSIRNVDKACDTTIFWPDTVLSINALGIYDLNENPETLQVFQNTPNPVQEQTRIMIFMPRNGIVTIAATLVSGKQVAYLSQELFRGYHLYIFRPTGSETCLFSVTANGISKSIKVISFADHSLSGRSIVYNGPVNEYIHMKSIPLPGKFTFVAGDQIEIKGYHNGLTAPYQDAPLTSTTYTLNFTPTGNHCTGVPTLTYMGQVYHTVQIGIQCWLRENLNFGTRIDGTQEQTDNGIIEKYCSDDLDVNCKIYGGLYQWNEMMQYVATSGAKGICPAGWHVPTDSDWSKLVDYLGGESLAGGKIKYTGTIEAGTGLWAAPNSGASNNTGFTALPAGDRNYSGSFNSLGFYTDFWSSTIGSNAETAWDRNLNYNYGNVYRSSFSKTYGFSCRCLKD